MIDDRLYSVFKQGSKTYFYSSIFFPKEVKKDVFALYAFVRTADDYVDAIPQQSQEFYQFRKDFLEARQGNPSGNIIIDSFVELEKRKGFEKSWADSFLASMEMDLTGKDYCTIEDVEEYMYGSAEVIGLFMAKTLGLPPASYPSARMLGKAMQYANFIRDIDEDWGMKRTYFPSLDFREFGISSLSQDEALGSPEQFSAFMRKQISRFTAWQAHAEKGFSFIPYRYRIPIKTASEMYKWTAKQIERDPFIVYKKKVKPGVARILFSAGKSAVLPGVSSKC